MSFFRLHKKGDNAKAKFDNLKCILQDRFPPNFIVELLKFYGYRNLGDTTEEALEKLQEYVTKRSKGWVPNISSYSIFKKLSPIDQFCIKMIKALERFLMEICWIYVIAGIQLKREFDDNQRNLIGGIDRNTQIRLLSFKENNNTKLEITCGENIERVRNIYGENRDSSKNKDINKELGITDEQVIDMYIYIFYFLDIEAIHPTYWPTYETSQDISYELSKFLGNQDLVKLDTIGISEDKANEIKDNLNKVLMFISTNQRQRQAQRQAQAQAEEVEVEVELGGGTKRKRKRTKRKKRKTNKRKLNS